MYNENDYCMSWLMVIIILHDITITVIQNMCAHDSHFVVFGMDFTHILHMFTSRHNVPILQWKYDERHGVITRHILFIVWNDYFAGLLNSVNLAHNRPAWVHRDAASSANPAQLGVDNDTSTMVISMASAPYAFFAVDLGAEMIVDSISLWYAFCK